MKKLLLHSCCGPCLSSVYITIVDDFAVTLFWFNPNIEPENEFNLRLQTFNKLRDIYQSKSIIKNGENRLWKKEIKGLENEPEGGKRCEMCIKFRLEKTAKEAKIKKYNIFATTLSVSPHKKLKMINEIGNELAKKYQVDFLPADFKKADGYKKSIELSKKYNLYRQSYCGCRYSIS